MIPVLLSLFLAAGGLAQAQTAPNPAASQPAAKPGRMEGQVVNSITNEPVRKATVTLRASGPNNRSGAGQLSVTTDQDGKFLFENVIPGDYRISAEKAGFVRPLGAMMSAMGGPMGGQIAGMLGLAPNDASGVLKLSEGGAISGLRIQLIPQGVISGKVLDEDGEGFGRVRVLVLEWNFTGGMARLLPAGTAETNELGDFRVANLAPGKYLVAAERGGGFAMGRGRGAMAGGGIAGAGGTQAPIVSGNETYSYARTYYPGVTEVEQAQKVTVNAGQELSGVTLNLRKTRVYSISGTIPAADPEARYIVQVSPVDTLGIGPLMGGGMAAVNQGAFVASNLLPGNYNLLVSEMGRERRPRVIARGEAAITNSDVTNAALAPVAATEIRGRIRIDGGPANIDFSRVRIEPRPREIGMGMIMNSGNRQQAIQADGTFRFAELSPGNYIFNVSAEAVQHYVKAITYNGQDIRASGLDLRNGGSIDLEVILSPKVAGLNGRVQLTEGANPGSVLVVREPYNPMKPGAKLQRTAAGEDGSFSVQNLEPGTYRLLAVEEADPKLIYDPEWLAARASESVTVELREAETKAVALRQIRN